MMSEWLIEKEFGPLDMCDLRITIDYERAEWVVERKIHRLDCITEWEVATRIDGQNTIEYFDDKAD
jgi:hypothetical protein